MLTTGKTWHYGRSNAGLEFVFNTVHFCHWFLWVFSSLFSFVAPLSFLKGKGIISSACECVCVRGRLGIER